jgi:hypothetical protein
VRRGERRVGLIVAIFLLGIIAVGLGWSVVRGEAEDEQVVGKYQFAPPNLILDTATGKLTAKGGDTLESPIDAGGKDVGRYNVAGYVTAVTRTVGLDMLNQPAFTQDLVKGYVIGDTKTGPIVKERVYYSAPLGRGEL